MTTPVTNHADQAVDRLLTQFRDRERLEGVVRALVAETQQIEDHRWEITNGRRIDDAAGYQLDLLGKLLGVERNGAADETYRTRLHVAWRLNTSSGSVEDLHELFDLLSPGSVRVDESYPASVSVAVTEPIPFEVAEGVTLLRRAKLGGVQAFFQWQDAESESLFRFDSGPGFNEGVLTGSLNVSK